LRSFVCFSWSTFLCPLARYRSLEDEARFNPPEIKRANSREKERGKEKDGVGKGGGGGEGGKRIVKSFLFYHLM